MNPSFISEVEYVYIMGEGPKVKVIKPILKLMIGETVYWRTYRYEVYDPNEMDMVPPDRPNPFVSGVVVKLKGNCLVVDQYGEQLTLNLDSIFLYHPAVLAALKLTL